MRVLAIAMVCAIGPLPAVAADFRTPIELKCEFGPFVSAVASPGSRFFTATINQATEADDITFFSISLDSRSARAEGRDIDSGQVIFDQWDATWTFTEYTYRGDVYVTQVFREDDLDEDKDVFRVVRSRQWAQFGSVYATQYYGFCRAVY